MFESHCQINAHRHVVHAIQQGIKRLERNEAHGAAGFLGVKKQNRLSAGGRVDTRCRVWKGMCGGSKDPAGWSL